MFYIDISEGMHLVLYANQCTEVAHNKSLATTAGKTCIII